MVRRIVLPAILFLIVAILGASVANAIGRRYALNTLEDMTADMYTIEQEIRTTMEGIFQEYGIEVPDKKSHNVNKGRHHHADLTDEQRTAIREKVAEMRK